MHLKRTLKALTKIELVFQTLQLITQIIRQAIFTLQTKLLTQAVANGLDTTNGDIQQRSNFLSGEIHLQIGTHHAFIIRDQDDGHEAAS